MDRHLFFRELSRLDYKNKPLSDFILPVTATHYSESIQEVARYLEKKSIPGLEALIAFGSHIRKPGISDIDTGLVVNEQITPEAVYEVERLLLSKDNLPYFYHRPGLTIPKPLFNRYRYLAPLFHDPKILWAQKNWTPVVHIPFDEDVANLISVTDYLLLTGVSEPFELWAQSTADIRLMLAKFGSCRHIKAIFERFKIPFSKNGQLLLEQTEAFSLQYSNTTDQNTPHVLEQLSEMTFLWFSTLCESIESLAHFIRTSLLSDNSAGSLTYGQLSESRPLVRNFSAEHAATLCVDALLAKIPPIVVCPVELGVFIIRSYQLHIPTLLAQMSCRLFYGVFITFKDDRFETVCKEKSQVFSEQLSFLNQHQIPYGTFHPYGTYFLASGPFNPHIERSLVFEQKYNELRSKVDAVKTTKIYKLFKTLGLNV